MTEPNDGDLDQVRQGLRMAAPPDPERLAAERRLLVELDAAPLAKRWGGYLKFIGPGYLQSAMTLGSGTAASSLFAGAMFGYDLLWVAPMGMLLGVLVMGVVSHQTLSTGRRVLPAMSEFASKPLAMGFAVAAMLASIIWHFAQYNLGASVVVDAATVLGVDGLPPAVGSTIILAWAVALSLTYGKSVRLVRVYERFLKYTVWAVVFLLLWVVVHTPTDWGGVLAGLIPSIPDDVVVPGANGEQKTVGAIAVIVAGLAAAVGINMLLLYPYSLQARGWGREHRGLAKFDLFTGMMVPYALASGLMVIASANTLGEREVGQTADVATLAGVLGEVIGPVAGRLLFDLGMLAMSLSTITLHMVCCGFVAMEWFGLPFGSRAQRLMTLLPTPAFLAPLLFSKYPVWLSIPTTIICGAMVPIAYMGFLILQRSKAYLGSDRQRGLSGAVAVASLLMASAVMVVSLGFYLVKQFGS